MYTHARQGEVNMPFLADLAASCGAPVELQQKLRAANTARHVLELCKEGNLPLMATAVCREAVVKMREHTTQRIDVWAYMVDFDGTLLALFPETASAVTVSE